MDAQLKRGILTICILQMVGQNDMYGYDIVKKMQEYFPETEESTLYAILRRLHKEKYTEVYLSEESLGPKRKYHKITEKGEEYLDDYIQSWFQIEEIFHQLGILSD